MDYLNLIVENVVVEDRVRVRVRGQRGGRHRYSFLNIELWKDYAPYTMLYNVPFTLPYNISCTMYVCTYYVLQYIELYVL